MAEKDFLLHLYSEIVNSKLWQSQSSFLGALEAYDKTRSLLLLVSNLFKKRKRHNPSRQEVYMRSRNSSILEK